ACFTFTSDADACAIRRARWNADCLLLASAVDNALGSFVGFVKRNFDRLFQVAALDRLLVSITSTGVCRAAEDIREAIRQVVSALLIIYTEATGCSLTIIAPVEAAALKLLVIRPKLIVFGAFISVAQHFVGFVDFLEMLFGAFIVRIHIRMIFTRQLPK